MTTTPGNQRILIVEDDPEVRRFLVEFLEEEGYEVDQASDGLAAIEKVGNGGHALMVLDMMLPDMTGEEVAERLRQKGHQPPTLLVTANGRAKESALTVGAFAYLSKPFELDAFLSSIERGLAIT